MLPRPAFFDTSFKCFETNSGGTGFPGDSRSFLGDPVEVFTVENSDELLISLDEILDSRSFFGDPVGIFTGEDELLFSLDGILEDSRSFFGDPVGVFTVENSDDLLISLDGILDS